MPKSTFIALDCEPSVLDEVVNSLVGFALAMLETDWLISAAYLQGSSGLLVASISINVLGDGTVARVLQIARPEGLLAELRESLPDIEHRMAARGHPHGLPQPPDQAGAPPMNDWFAGGYRTQVLLRRVETYQATHRIACGLLFTRRDNEQLLIGADVTTPAMVASQDSKLIDAYLADCDAVDIETYRARLS